MMESVEISMDEINKMLPLGLVCEAVTKLRSGSLQILAQDSKGEKSGYILKPTGQFIALRIPNIKFPERR